MIEIQKSNGPFMPGTWRGCICGNEISIVFTCPICGNPLEIDRSEHIIDPDGTVQAAMKCTGYKCPFSDFIKLKNWT